MIDGAPRTDGIRRVARGDVAAGLVLLVLGGISAFASVKYGLGKLSAPGPGFLPFGAAVLIVILALVVLRRELAGTFRPETDQTTSKTSLGDVLAVLTAMAAYAVLLPEAGFLATTALFVGFLLRFIGRKSWLVTLLVAGGVAVAADLLFVVFLAVQMPVTPFGF